jgi:hypothetical protein
MRPGGPMSWSKAFLWGTVIVVVVFGVIAAVVIMLGLVAGPIQ